MITGEDPRAIANFVLDVSSDINQPASNLTLNKVIYFLHGAYLAKTGNPLVDARIEAWEYGPVIREVYHEFKGFRDRPITDRARKVNRITGKKEICGYWFSDEDRFFLEHIASTYLKIRPGALVDLSHIHDGPWHEVWFHDGRVNPGMEITNDLIEKHFRNKGRH